MAHLIYTTNTSLDGFIEDMDGKFDWTDPSEEVFQFITNLIRTDGTHLYGRRTYENMMVWETDPNLAGQSPLMRDFAQVWQAADKIVYSRTLEAASTRKTKIERNFDPEAIRRLKESVEQDIHIGGAELADRLQRHQHAQQLRPPDRRLPQPGDRAGAAADPQRAAQSRRHRHLADRADPPVAVHPAPDLAAVRLTP